MTTEPWPRTTLGEALGGKAALRTGPFGNQLRASEYVPHGVPVVMPKDLVGGSIKTDKIAHVSNDKACQLPGYRVRAEDILLARRGEMGRCARVEHHQDGWICGTGCLMIRANARLDSQFLTNLLRWTKTVAWLGDHAVGQTLPHLNTKTLGRLPVDLPNLAEQRRIAVALEKVDGAIDAAYAVTEQMKRVREECLRTMLAGQDRESAVTAHWEWRPLDSLCTMSNGYAFKVAERSNQGLPIIRIQNLNGSRQFNYFSGQPAPGWTVETGDLLFGWAGVKGSSFGPCIWRGPRGVLNQHIFRLQPTKGVTKEWLFEALRLVTHELERQAHGFKASLVHIRKSEIKEHRVRLPPIEVQRHIASTSRQLTEMEDVETSILLSLVRLRDGLANDLLSGRVRTLRD